MPSISVAVSQFTESFSHLNGDRNIIVSRRRCQKHAMVMGAQVASPFLQQSASSIAFGNYKALAMRVGIDFSQNWLALPDNYTQLDPTEKVNIAFWLGMTFATIYADDILGVPRLYHAASMRSAGRLTATGGRSLADLVGQDVSDGWHVIEAKGRQSDPSNTMIDNWKIQARTITRVDDTDVKTNSIATCLIQGRYSGQLIDPDASEKEIVEISFPDGNITRFSAYYSRYVEFLRAGSTLIRRGERTIRVRLVTFNSIDNEYIFAGMDETVFSIANDGLMPPTIQSSEGPDFYIGADGIALVTSQSSDVA